MKTMRISMMLSILMLVATVTYAQQHYRTTGIVQYQKLDGYNYKRTLMLPSLAATWSFYTDNKLVRVLEGDKVVMEVKRKYKSGTSTVYIISQIISEMKVIIDGKSVTTIEGDNDEIKSVYKITKVEKTTGPYGDNY